MQYHNTFVYPRKSFIGMMLSALLNNILFIKAKRFIFYPFTQARLKSDIKNVVFLNWMVPLDKVKHLVPEHVKIKSYDDHALLSVLTYNHGNFRPAAFNTIKSIFASPLQSNWRLYVENTQSFQVNEPAVFFVKNIIDSATYTVGSRVFSNILLTHLPDTFEHSIDPAQLITKISPGLSNAPDLNITLKPAFSWRLPSIMQSTFSTVEDLLHTICNQEFAISDQPDHAYSVAKIDLKFNSDIKPLEVTSVESVWLNNIIAGADCFAFFIQDVTFLTLGEKIIKIKNHEHT